MFLLFHSLSLSVSQLPFVLTWLSNMSQHSVLQLLVASLLLLNQALPIFQALVEDNAALGTAVQTSSPVSNDALNENKIVPRYYYCTYAWICDANGVPKVRMPHIYMSPYCILPRCYPQYQPVYVCDTCDYEWVYVYGRAEGNKLNETKAEAAQ